MSARTLELGLTLRLPEGDRDVLVDARADATVGELVAALAEHARQTPRGVLYTDRGGRLAAADPLVSAGLREGDIVSLDGPVAPRIASPRGSTGPVVALCVTGGPAAGHREALGPGRYVVGREAGVDLPIADASLSRQHFAIEVGRDGSVNVADAGSRNGTAIEGVGLAPGSHPLAVGRTVEAGRSTFAVEPWTPPIPRRSRGPVIDFNRQPRVSRGYEPPTLRLDPPPQKLRAFKIPFVVALMPLVMGVAIYLVTKSPMMLLMGAFSPIMMIGSAVGTKRAGSKEHGEQVAQFEAGVNELTSQLEQARTQEQYERRATAPHAADLVARATDLRDDLWERRPADRDFLDVRVGTADQPSIVQVAFQSGGDPELRRPAEERIEAARVVPVVPVRLRFAELGTVGLVGDGATVEGIARWIMVQHATLQSPRDVVIAATLSPERADRWRWLSWLPHSRHPASPIEGDHIAVGEAASRALLRQLSTIADERREEQEQQRNRPARRRTSIVLLVDEDVAPEATVIDGLLQDCAQLDIAVVWLGRERRHLPGAVGAIIEAASERSVIDVTFTRTGQRIEDASLDALSLPVADAVARSLAPLKDVTAGGAAAAVPRSVSLVELLDLIEPTADQIRARWRTREPQALNALIGISSDGPFSLDLRIHGPHALVAGTTGAGKSEFLQTFISALAASHPPDRIAFLLVDYKGGAAFKDCARLPHSVGMVTDLDAHQVQRALVSLNAELKRREHVLAEHGVRDLMELERRNPAEAPPSLVIVIDEFATLAKEVPEFVEGVVDVAQRGRSLGVHLVLATQRPGNAVTDNIRANTSLRIALRVAGANESDDVIGAPDAARLPRSIPGRALARTSPTDLEQFQAGYVGALTEAAGSGDRVEVRDRVPKPTVTTKGGTPVVETTTDLELLVEAISAATTASGIAEPPSPWRPPLPLVLGAEEQEFDRSGVTLGLIDEPTRQRQVPYELDLAAVGSMLIFGGSGAGKTTVLRTLACALAEAYDPDDLHIYGLDFAGLGLRPLEALPHVGSIIPGDDGERLGRLVAVLRRAIDDRARRFASARVNDLDAYNRAMPQERLPRIVVLLDSYGAFYDAYERVDIGAMVEAVPRLIADGRTAGIHFVITADRRGAVPTTLASIIAERVILRMASEDELQMLGVDTKSLKGVKLPPGRGFLQDGRDVQIAVVGATADATAQVAAIGELGAKLAAATPHRAKPIATLPEEVPLSALDGAPTAPLVAPFAIDDLDLAPVHASLEDAHFVVIGPYRSGRSTALHTIATEMREATPDLTVHLLAPRRSPLPELEGWDSVARGGEECEDRLRELFDELLGGAAGADDAPVLIVIDDAGEFADSSIASTLESLIKRGRDANVRIVASMETGQGRHYAAWIKELRKDGRGMLLDPNLDLDGDLLGVRLPRRSNALFPPGRGFVVSDGRLVLAQVARG